jgi:hypothetical protein
MAEAVFRLAAGNWTITVTAAVDGTPVGYGSTVVDVTGRSGQRAAVNLDFYQEADFDTDGSPLTDETVDNVFSVMDADGWTRARAAIASGGNNKNYLINVTGSVTGVAGVTSPSFGSVSGIRVVLSGGGLALDTGGSLKGSLLRIGANQTVVLRDVTLTGITTNNTSLVYVDGGDLVMRSGAEITGNTNTAGNGGGVYMDGGSITLYGGKISENTVYGNGGGVYCDGAVLELRGGEISGNSIESGPTHLQGGGIYTRNSSTVRIYSGSVKNNSGSALGFDCHPQGIGISMENSILLMEGGFIEGNTAYSDNNGTGGGAYGSGVGVYIANGFFTMKGGAVRGNYTSYGNGNSWAGVSSGGVFVDGTAVFTMEGGVISGNTVVAPQANHMTSGYYIGAYGGGVRVNISASIVKTGGVIYGSEAVGNDADGFPLRNVAMHNGTDIATAVVVDTGGTPASPYAGGHAVVVIDSPYNIPVKWRDATADENTNLNSSNLDNWSY